MILVFFFAKIRFFYDMAREWAWKFLKNNSEDVEKNREGV